MALPPGPRMPGSLALLTWMRRPAETFEENFARYGDLYTINNPLFGKEVVVSHPDDIKQVLAGDPAVFLGGEANAMISVVVGDRSVLLLDGPEHHRQRKLLMPPFHGERLGVYAKAIRRITETAIATLPRAEPVALLPTFQRITFDVILETVFGASEGAEMDLLRDRLLALVDRAQSPLGMLWLLPAFRVNLGPLTGWAAIARAIREADLAIYALIARARAAGGAAAGTDILSMLLAARDDAGDPMTDKELRDELMTLLLAGHETTATALAWAVDEVARRPDVMARLEPELDAAAAGLPAPYLDAAFKETLRLHPIAPLLARKTAAPVTLRGFDIPAGTFLVMCPYNAQRHPAYWEAPAEFRPERFLGTKIDPYAWVPFGGGARRCIGMAFATFEAKVVLGVLFKALAVELPGPRARVKLRSFMFAPEGGPRAVVRERPAEKGGTAETPRRSSAPARCADAPRGPAGP